MILSNYKIQGLRANMKQPSDKNTVYRQGKISYTHIPHIKN